MVEGIPAGLLRDLQRRLEADGDAGKRDWWTRYLKGTAEFRGTPMDAVRSHVHAWWSEHRPGPLRRADPVEVAAALIRQPMTEDKLAGMLLLGERLIPDGDLDPDRDLPRLAELFDEGHLADWNAVDWFCVKVLGAWVAHLEGPGAASPRAELGRAISAWRDAPTGDAQPWRRRASAVAFVNHVKLGDAFFDGLVDEVLTSCAVLAADERRFAQTGAGWVLRELSVAEPDRVRAFIAEHEATMSSEALKSARKKLG